MLRAASEELSGEDRARFAISCFLARYSSSCPRPAYFWTITWIAPIPRDATTLVVGRDFMNFWMYGRAAAFTADPGRFYDPASTTMSFVALLGPDYFGNNWSYPPSIMLIAAPFGRLDLSCRDCSSGQLLGLAIFLWVARSLSPIAAC